MKKVYIDMFFFINIRCNNYKKYNIYIYIYVGVVLIFMYLY